MPVSRTLQRLQTVKQDQHNLHLSIMGQPRPQKARVAENICPSSPQLFVAGLPAEAPDKHLTLLLGHAQRLQAMRGRFRRHMRDLALGTENCEKAFSRANVGTCKHATSSFLHHLSVPALREDDLI